MTLIFAFVFLLINIGLLIFAKHELGGIYEGPSKRIMVFNSDLEEMRKQVNRRFSKF